MKFPTFSLSNELSALKKFENLKQNERNIVFYSENENSMFIFKPLIDELVVKYNLNICYVTSSKNESILTTSNDKIKSFCIGDGIVRTKFFMNLKADILIMTMPDLETFHIKRSKLYPVHYVYLFHAMVSTHLVYQKGAFDHYDTILCTGNYQLEEIRSTEKLYDLKPKQLLKCGYPHLDELLEKYPKKKIKSQNCEKKFHILLAPSWGSKGIFETCIENLIELLLHTKYQVTFRPHPMTLKKSKNRIELIKKKFSQNSDFYLEQDISDFNSFFLADVMITDWSGSALEFSFAFEKPIIFIDTPKKIHNLEYDKIPQIPIEDSIRNKIGKIISPKDLEKIPNEIEKFYTLKNESVNEIKQIRNDLIFNVGKSKEYAAEQFIKLLKSKDDGND